MKVSKAYIKLLLKETSLIVTFFLAFQYSRQLRFLLFMLDDHKWFLGLELM